MRNRTGHYVLVQGTRIVADCIVSADSSPADTATQILAMERRNYPDAAIYVRLGTEEPVTSLLFPSN